MATIETVPVQLAVGLLVNAAWLAIGLTARSVAEARARSAWPRVIAHLLACRSAGMARTETFLSTLRYCSDRKLAIRDHEALYDLCAVPPPSPRKPMPP